ncbi:hypothetical protein LP419_09325 [Massilia sp. H-1]|nr:hypothetical protein LP419_09325 [Massilia sp. H-1]
MLSSLPEFKPLSPTGARRLGQEPDPPAGVLPLAAIGRRRHHAHGATNSYGGDYLAPPAYTCHLPRHVLRREAGLPRPGVEHLVRLPGLVDAARGRVLLRHRRRARQGRARQMGGLGVVENHAGGRRQLCDPQHAVLERPARQLERDNTGRQCLGLRVTVVDTTNDVGVAAAYARTLIYYAAKANHAAAKSMAKALLDRMWAKHQDALGLAVDEKRADYLRFDDAFDPATGSGVFIPSGWSGTNGQGAALNASSTFLSMRPKYQQDPQWPKLKAYLDGGAAPSWRYHRFWAQADIAMAMSDYANLIGGTTTPAIVASTAALSVPEGGSANVGITLSAAPAANVNVAVAKAMRHGDADLSTTSTTLVFTLLANYNVAQNVNIRAAVDADQINGSASFNFGATGYLGAAVTAREVDKDVPVPVTLVVSGAPLTVPEGTSRSFQVRLGAAPAGNVSVAVARSGGDTDLSVAAASAALTFTLSQLERGPERDDCRRQRCRQRQRQRQLRGDGHQRLSSVTVNATETDKDVVVKQQAAPWNSSPAMTGAAARFPPSPCATRARRRSMAGA